MTPQPAYACPLLQIHSKRHNLKTRITLFKDAYQLAKIARLEHNETGKKGQRQTYTSTNTRPRR